MSTTTSKRSLKRLSLLQSPPPTSATTGFHTSELYEGANEAGPSSAPLPVQRSPKSTASEFPLSTDAVVDQQSSNLKLLKNTRRQSSICYFSTDREPSPTVSPSLPSSRRFSAQAEQISGSDFDRKSEDRRRKERRRASVQVLQRPLVSDGNDFGRSSSPHSAHDRTQIQEPLTLAER